MLPRVSSRLVSTWIVVTIVASLVAVLDGGWLANWAALAPSKVWHGQIWRLATWPFVEPGPMGLVFTCVAIYYFGGHLTVRWGDRRLRRFAIHVLGSAAVATCVLSALAGGAYVSRLGGWAVADMLVIAWARQFPERTLALYGVLHLRGRELVRITLGVAIVFAVYFGPIVMAPELVACAAAAAYPRSLLRRT